MRQLCGVFVVIACLIAILQSPVWAQKAGAPAAVAPASSAPSAAPVIPFDLTPSHYSADSAVLFVLADGGDAPTRGRFVSEVTRQLQTFYDVDGNLQLVPEPNWSLVDYMNTCANVVANTRMRGALIVEIGSISNSSANWFWQKASWTELSGALLFSSCSQDRSKNSSGDGKGAAESTPNPLTPISQRDLTWEKNAQHIKYSVFNTPSPKATPTPYLMRWATRVYDQTGYTKNITVLPVTGVLLALVSSAVPFIPSRTTTGQDTITYPTPYPWLPGSSNGYVSSRQSTNETTTNTQNETNLATSFLSSSITYDQNLNALPTTSDDSSMRAVRSVVASFLAEIGCDARDGVTANGYGVDLRKIQKQATLCSDLAPSPIPSPPPSPPAGTSPDGSFAHPYITPAPGVTITLAGTAIGAPQSAIACDERGAPSKQQSCGLKLSATISNRTANSIDQIRLRCKDYDAKSDLVLHNEAAEPFGPLPLDPSDSASYDFYVPKIFWSTSNNLKCILSFKSGDHWYNPPESSSGIY